MYEKSYLLQLIQDFDYEKALLFYSHYTKADRVLVKIFNRSQTQYNKETLKKELQKILNDYEHEENIDQKLHIKKITDRQQAVEGKAVSPQTATVVKGFYFDKYEKAPNEVQAVVSKIKIAYRKKDFLFAQLEHEKSDAERLQEALEILELSDTITEGFELLELFDSTGQLPVVSQKNEISVQSIDDLYRLRNNYKVYKSRAKDKPKELEKWAKKLEDIEKQINAIQ